MVIRREEQHVDPADARAQLNDRNRDIFAGKTFEAVPFLGDPFDVPDEVGDGRPKLIVFAYDGLAVDAPGTPQSCPLSALRSSCRAPPRMFGIE